MNTRISIKVTVQHGTSTYTRLLQTTGSVALASPSTDDPIPASKLVHHITATVRRALRVVGVLMTEA
jgi:hypothetical protein